MKPKTGGVIGIDPNSEYLALSNGLKIPNLKPAKKLLYKGKRAIKKSQQKIRGSSSWHKAKKELKKLHEKIKNQRLDYTHKLSNLLVSYFDQIAIEYTNNKELTPF